MGTYLDERLDLAPLGQLLRSHSFCHLPGVTLDTSDNGMRERSLLGTLIILLDNDDLLSGLASLEDDSNLCDTVKSRNLRMSFRVNRPDLSGLVDCT